MYVHFLGKTKALDFLDHWTTRTFLFSHGRWNFMRSSNRLPGQYLYFAFVSVDDRIIVASSVPDLLDYIRALEGS